MHPAYFSLTKSDRSYRLHPTNQTGCSKVYLPCSETHSAEQKEHNLRLFTCSYKPAVTFSNHWDDQTYSTVHQKMNNHIQICWYSQDQDLTLDQLLPHDFNLQSVEVLSCDFAPTDPMRSNLNSSHCIDFGGRQWELQRRSWAHQPGWHRWT